MRSPLVTIVTPSYNQGQFIRATIESVLAQDYSGIEYIIMDGGSTDQTASVAAEYSSRLTFISESDRGQSDAINKGFRRARGSLVSWLNSDDTILPGAVRRAVAAFERSPELGAVYGEGYLIDYDGNVRCRFPATEPFDLWRLVYLYDYILQQTVYFRRAVFDDIGYLDESLYFGMDWEILMRIGKRYPIQYIHEYMGCLREYEAAKSFSGGHRRFKELTAILRRHGDLRYPPGYFWYGLGTYSKILTHTIDRLTPAVLGGFSKSLQTLIMHIAHAEINRLTREAQGRYQDGWAGPRVHCMVPAGTGPIRVTGTLPPLHPSLNGQQLQIVAGGVVLTKRDLNFGDFDFLAPMPCEWNGNPVRLEFRSSAYVVPKQKQLGSDSRRLSYILNSIERVAAA